MPINVPRLVSNVREGNKWTVFENRVLRRIFGPKRKQGKEAEESCIMGSFTKHY
jgi:hypothetical protein